MANPQLLSGARGLIQKFNRETGQFETLAFATDISVNERAGVRQTWVMGSMNPAAIDPLSIDVDVSIGRVVPVNNPDGSNKNPSAIAAGLETVINQMVSAEDLNIALQDKVTGKYILSVKNCRFAGRTFGTNAGDVANERFAFTGIYDSGYDSENTATDGYGL